MIENITLIILILTIVAIILIAAVYNKKDEIKKAVGGSEDMEPRKVYLKDAPIVYPGLQCVADYDKDFLKQLDYFELVDPNENERVYVKLFKNGPYSSYRNKNANNGNLDYIIKISRCKSMNFYSDDFMYNMDVECNVSVGSQVCYHNDKVYNCMHVLPSVSTYRMFTVLMDTLYLLPEDATDEPIDGKKKYTCLHVQGWWPTYIEYAATLYKNVNIIVYNDTNVNYNARGKFEQRLGIDFTDKIADTLIGKVDVIFFKVNGHSGKYVEDRDCRHAGDIKWVTDTIQKIAPKYGAVSYMYLPQSNNTKECEIPAPDEYQVMAGRFLTVPFNKPQYGEIAVLTLPEEYGKLQKLNYEDMSNRMHKLALKQVWATFNPELPAEYDLKTGEYKLVGKANVISCMEFRKLRGYDRCFSCARYTYTIGKFIYKYHRAEYSAQKVMDIVNEAATYLDDMFFGTMNLTPAVDIRIGESILGKNRSIFRAPHGAYKHLSRFNFHLKFIDWYENALYKSINEKPEPNPIIIKAGSDDKKKERRGKISGNEQIYDKKSICDKLDKADLEIVKSWPGALDDYSKFNTVDVNENKELFNKFFTREYSQYKRRTENSGCYEFAKYLSTLPEQQFSHVDYIYNPHEKLTIKHAAPQNMTYDYNSPDRAVTIQRSDEANRYPALEIRNISQFKSLTHIGKVKLFIADVQAILYLLPSDAKNKPNNGQCKYTIIYIGSAPGHQTPILSNYFRNVKFILYDGAKFSKYLDKCENVELHNEFFTKEHTDLYKNKIDILISDVRLWLKKDADESQLQIHNDMMMQQDWVLNIKPKFGSMLKFCPPYSTPTVGETEIPNVKDYKYIGGTVYWQAFPHIQSTEGRLLSTAKDIEIGPVPFDYIHYEAAALEHNLRRVWCTYKAGIPESFGSDGTISGALIDAPELIKFPGYDRCLDCTYVFHVISHLIYKYDRSRYNKEEVKNFVRFILGRTVPFICACERTPSKTSELLHPHGYWQNLTRFQKHEKFLYIYDNYMYKK